MTTWSICDHTTNAAVLRVVSKWQSLSLRKKTEIIQAVDNAPSSKKKKEIAADFQFCQTCSQQFLRTVRRFLVPKQKEQFLWKEKDFDLPNMKR